MYDILRSATPNLCLAALLICGTPNSQAEGTLFTGKETSTITQSQVTEQVAHKLPLAFEENRGQTDPSVKFFSRTPEYQLFLSPQEAVMVFEKEQREGAATNSGATANETSEKKENAVIRMRFIGGNKTPTLHGIEPLHFKTNYFIGADNAQRITDIPNYVRVKYESLYPGVDVIYYGNRHRLEYDFIVAPNASPDGIQFTFAGAKKISLSDKGNLVLATTIGDVIHHKPVAYQDIDGKRTSVEANYEVTKNGTVGFRLGKYDKSRALVIDPIVEYSTFLWGASTTRANSIAVDSNGSVYIAGRTSTAAFPAATSFQTRVSGDTDAYIIKLDPTGTKVIYASYIGGRGTSTVATALTVDVGGSAYLAGATGCALPTTTGAYQTSCSVGSENAFVAKVNSAGNALIYSSYLAHTQIRAVATDSNGNAYVTGSAYLGFSSSTTPGAFQTAMVQNGGRAPFAAKFNPTGTALTYATYLSGHSYVGYEEASAIAVDSVGNAYITGATWAYDFPTYNAFQPYHGTREYSEVFITKLNPTGSGLVFSSFFGGTRDDEARSIALDSSGQIYVGGVTRSDDLPVTPNAFQTQKGIAGTDPSGFVAKISNDGTRLLYSSYLGSQENLAGTSAYIGYVTAVAVDAAGYLYAAGSFPQGLPLVDSINEFGPVTRTKDYGLPAIVKITPDGSEAVYSTVIGRFPTTPEYNYYANAMLGLATSPNGGVFGLGATTDPNSYSSTAGAPLTTGYTFLLKLNTGKFPTTVKSSVNPALTGQPITLTARVESTKLGGNVTFMDGTTMLAEIPIHNGVAKLTTTLPVGVHKITATYNADGSTSPPVFQVVNSASAW